MFENNKNTKSKSTCLCTVAKLIIIVFLRNYHNFDYASISIFNI